MKKKISIFFILLSIGVWNLSAQNIGLLLQPEDKQDIIIGKRWAVFIAIDEYREWESLSNQVKDATEIKNILLNNNHIDEVLELYNQDATAAGIRQLSINLHSKIKEEDSVIIFYSGHGYTDIYSNTGFWIPSDGGRDISSQTNWISAVQIRYLFSQLPVKRVFMVSNTCFSFDVFDMSRGMETVIDKTYLDLDYLYYLFSIVRDVRRAQPMLGNVRGRERQDCDCYLSFIEVPESEVEIALQLDTEKESPVIEKQLADITSPPDIKERKDADDRSKHLWSVGASVGSSMAAPWLIGTIRGTISPIRNSFLEVGFDVGFLSGDSEVGYYSIYPYVFYAFLLPINDKFNWYIGAGGGYLRGKYEFPEGSVPVSIFAAQLVSGFYLFDLLNISYTIRTNFSGVSNKVSIGYAYRFK